MIHSILSLFSYIYYMDYPYTLLNIQGDPQNGIFLISPSPPHSDLENVPYFFPLCIFIEDFAETVTVRSAPSRAREASPKKEEQTLPLCRLEATCYRETLARWGLLLWDS